MTVEVTYTYNKCGISYTCLVTSILHMPLLHDTGDPAPKKKIQSLVQNTLSKGVDLRENHLW